MCRHKENFHNTTLVTCNNYFVGSSQDTFYMWSEQICYLHSSGVRFLQDSVHQELLKLIHFNWAINNKGAHFYKIKKPHKGADSHHCQHARLLATYLQSQSQFQKFRSPVTLTLDRVKVISTCVIPVELPACSTMPHTLPKYGHLNFVKYQHSAKFELSW